VQTLKRITTRYDQAEDRLRLDGRLNGEATLSLWLTQRLMIRLVRHLTRWLDRQELPAEPSARPDPLAHSTKQGFAQQSAAATMAPVEPVSATDAATSALVHEIDIRAREKAIMLVFKLPDGTEVGLPFEPVQLRQWLAIVLAKWHRAEWRDDVWPRWMLDSIGPASGEGGAFH